MVSFWIRHAPVPQPRPRFARRGKWVTAVSNPKGSRIVAFKAAARQAASAAFAGLAPLAGGVVLEAHFFMPRPQRLGDAELRVLHTVRPDLDNLLKGLKDALGGVAWQDDQQVCTVHAWKVYADFRVAPGVFVSVQEVRP